MNVSPIQPTPIQPQPAASIESRRAALQAALLKKTVELQQEQQVQMSREAEGKGNAIDIRV